MMHLDVCLLVGELFEGHATELTLKLVVLVMAARLVLLHVLEITVPAQ